MNVFAIADTHFDQESICHFLNTDGSKVRPWDNSKDMNEALIQGWNEVVKPGDKVYHLGDVSMSKKAIATIAKCNGKKVLIKGNHDIFRLKDYVDFFYDIRAYHKLDNFIMSHIPIHPDSLTNRWCEGNIHGHMHNNVVMNGDHEDTRYFNVSVERINFKPIPLEEVFQRIRNARK